MNEVGTGCTVCVDGWPGNEIYNQSEDVFMV